ncbi:hypothetical protein CF15_03800 [Pyrodictium occultum]|uniref:Thioredoxin domain-containing protein n=1 Tax=Pyrodictium occultum TaxID=2309 RepID=A0A0V8RV75_PYROC|nr:thioredoxin family protein [Pyrodictium occultum]KSW11928.1 hypothetical protein CF15_03800 [Pyrodictium occultum]
MLEVQAPNELEELIRSTRILLVLFYDSRSPNGRYLAGIVEDIARAVEPVIAVARVDAATLPGVVRRYARSVPRLQLYFDGEKVWEQIGFFYNSASDRYAIRRGILYALRSRNTSPSRLGISLRF